METKPWLYWVNAAVALTRVFVAAMVVTHRDKVIGWGARYYRPEFTPVTTD